MQSSKDETIVHATSATFEKEVLTSALPVVIDFWAPWCGPCRALGPILEKLSVGWADRVKTVKINVDEEPELAQSFRIASIPTMVAMAGEQVVDVQIGLGGVPAVERLYRSAAEAMKGEEPAVEVA